MSGPPETPHKLVLATAVDEAVPGVLRSLAEDFAAKTDMVLAIAGTGTDAVFQDAAIALAHGFGSGIFNAARLPPHVALVRPLPGQALDAARLDGHRILIIAGATDPAMPASVVGDLADGLDGAGATTEVHWNAGAGEITDAELDRLSQWLAEARAALTDPRQLPLTEEISGDKGRYLITAPGGVFAEMSFSRVNRDLIIIDHTEVPDVFAGTGTGRRLLEHAIAEARAAGTRIIPLCPFATAQFKKHPEWNDVLETAGKSGAGA